MGNEKGNRGGSRGAGDSLRIRQSAATESSFTLDRTPRRQTGGTFTGTVWSRSAGDKTTHWRTRQTALGRLGMKIIQNLMG